MTDTATTEDLTEAPATLEDYMRDQLTPEQQHRLVELLEQTPKFKPVKALSASGKMEFSAAVSSLRGIQEQLAAAEWDEDLVMAASAAMVGVCESALRLMAVSGVSYDNWSASIEIELIVPVVLQVFEKQSRLLGK